MKTYIYILALFFCTSAISQKTIDEDPELAQNNINYRIAESQAELENFNYFKAKQNLDEALKPGRRSQ